MPVIAGAVAGSLVLVLIVILGAIYFWRWRIKAENKRLKLTAKLTGMDESEVCQSKYKYREVSLIIMLRFKPFHFN